MFKYLGKIFLVKPESLYIEEVSFYKEFNFKNFIFFRNHFEENFKDYLEGLKSKLAFLKFLAVDQEGGRVVRIPGDFEAPLEIAKKSEKEGEEIFIRWSKRIAQSLKEHFLNLNLSPVVDLEDEGAEDFIKKRTFGKDAKKVTTLAEKFISIHKALGIEVCLKHFPGLGGVKIDPHKELPIKEQISEEDIYPFKRLSSKVNFVMTTHLLVPSFDSYPITFSEKIVKKLREECNFKGVILTDDLEMGALKSYELPERIIRSITSGHNLIIYTGSKSELISAFFEIKGEIEKSPILKEKLRESLTILENVV